MQNKIKMPKNNEANEKYRREDWTPASRSVSEIENIIHGIGEKLVKLVQKKVNSDMAHNGFDGGEETRGIEKITLEFLYDVSQTSMLVKINDFFTLHTYRDKFDSEGNLCVYEDLNYGLKPDDARHE